ncbi:MAG: ArsA family ATPase [Deltaproteobacteria bacterium]|nr:ArsA family ATPase [Deltaproteobacteria bacterium]
MSQATPSEALLGDRRIVVCVGTGGVGKTTVAAAIALEAACRGKRSLVLTIDPARRLADALGLEGLDNEPREISVALDGTPVEGKLFAMMLDMKSTFDDLVNRFTDDAQARERILANPIYQHLSDALAGSAEYAAMEKVFELSENRDFDFIVVDTPPSQHALDFLDAPRRMVEFLDSRLVQLLLHPAMSAGRLGFRLFQRPAQGAFHLLERITGIGFLEDLSEFLMAIEGMSEGFKDRAIRVRARLLGSSSAFVLVAGPSPEATRNANLFLAHLDASRVPLVGVVVNRTHLWPGKGPPPQELDPASASPEDLALLAGALAVAAGDADPAAHEPEARAAVAAASDYAAQVRMDITSSEPLRADAVQNGRFFRRVPELPLDVHDLAGLAQIRRYLFRDDGSAAELEGGEDLASTHSEVS